MAEPVIPTQVVTAPQNPPAAPAAVANPTATAPAPAQAAAPSGAPDPTAPTLTLEQALKELEKVRREAAKYRTEKKTAEDESLTEVQKLTKSVEQIQQQLKTTQRENMQLKIAKKYNLPDALASRLAGETEDEMDADGQALAAVILKAAPTSTTTVTAPAVAPTSPTGLTTLTREAIEKMTPEEINKNWDAVSTALSKK